ncbi:MAG: hypothetical protein IJ161_08360 [Bacteroidales bacterium]|nr:hypothetical protein [Bacteroidales bacterium]
MRNEVPKVEFFIKKEAGRLKKTFLRNFGTFPFFYQTTYIIPDSRNRYLVWFCANNKRELNTQTARSGCCLILNEDKGKTTVYEYKECLIPNTYPKKEIEAVLNVYTGHFFSRYRERAGWGTKLTRDEIIVRYLCRNAIFISGLPFDKINLNSDKYPGGAAGQVTDGLVLITETHETDTKGLPFTVIKHNTFIGKTHLKEDQQENMLDENEAFALITKEYGFDAEIRKQLEQ